MWIHLMFGERAAPHLMQLFNEYMHQMVLLRDALLPFQNYQEVLIPVDRKARGIRHLEGARGQFLAELLTKHTTQQGIVAYAKALLAPGLLHTARGGIRISVCAWHRSTGFPSWRSDPLTPATVSAG